jgi:hypothetical protein
MGRTILIVLLSLGAATGFAVGFHRLGHYGHRGHRHAEFENHVADVCVRAAERTLAERREKTASVSPAGE